MVVVRGTKKFLDRVGRVDDGGVESSGCLGDWYANVWFWRPQVAIFVNARTLLPVVVPFAPAASVLKRFPFVFAEVARRIGADGNSIETEVQAMNEYALSKTASRSVLGTMNEFSHMADNYRWRNDVIDLVELSLWLAQVPCRPLFSSQGTPEDELRALLR
jgi:Domain of unknown function (DUF6933)